MPLWFWNIPMTKIFINQEFECFYDRNSRRVFHDLEFKKCRFVSSSLSITRNPRRRSLAQNIKLIQCEEIGCAIDTAVIEDVVVDGLKTRDLLVSWGAVFKHLVLKGNIGRIMISPAVATGMAKPREQAAFNEVNARYYETVDWALDISEGRFYECGIRRVPAKLIRHDPETQIVVKREKALLGEWKKLDLTKTYWATSIQLFLDRGDPDVVLVAPKRHRFLGWFEDATRRWGR
jgi:hypothetical protein